MINPKDFYDLLIKNEVGFFTGVPDSLLKSFCAYLTDNVEEKKHILAANEGGAVSLASGYFLSTGKPGLVYMQNSGQGNAINPLISLVDSDVYSIPLLLLIGWRGEPGKKDEPQHVKQGKITLSLLETLEIPYEILPESIEDLKKIINKAQTYMKEKKTPFALIVKKGTFEEYKLQNKIETSFEMNRETAIKIITNYSSSEDIVVSTTGKTSRELFDYREENNQGHEKDFLTVGAMGHASQIAIGIALQKPKRQIYCFDGDGAVIMHMGSIVTIGQYAPPNFKHIIFNNGSYDSVGGQSTAGFNIDLQAIAKACGYKTVLKTDTIENLKENIKILRSSEGPVLLEILINKGARKDLGRPTKTPIENKEDFMKFLSK